MPNATILNIEEPTLDPSIFKPSENYRFHTMLKPSGAQCNLDCTYCFYLHKEGLLHQPTRPRMNVQILETHIQQYIEAQTGSNVVFSWQGGEPTLMGLDFFEQVVALQEKYKKPNQRIENDLQTNGVLLNDSWAIFLKKHNFIVGLSIDGPSRFHDIHRVKKSGAPTFSEVMRAVTLLHKHKVPFNALCVINRENCVAPLEVYRFLRDEVKPQMIQLIPGMEKRNFDSTAPGHWTEEGWVRVDSLEAQPGHPNSVVTPWSVPPVMWGKFLVEVWDEWLANDYGRIHVDQFENVLSMILGEGSQQCVTSEVCGKALALEHNGDLYSCDHFVYPEYKLGNIQISHQGNMAFSKQQEAFGYAKSKTLSKECLQCNYLSLCWGHCPKDRFLKTKHNEKGLHYLCNGLKVFYKHVTHVCDELV
ncbi:MAG: anaerobic sulfatase maturase [Methylococcales bacterium]|nr:anaerobic sulfatase maturase [Methylococcales bacterium]